MNLELDPVTGGGQESWLEQKFEEIRALGGECALVWVNIKRFLYYRCRYINILRIGFLPICRRLCKLAVES